MQRKTSVNVLHSVPIRSKNGKKKILKEYDFIFQSMFMIQAKSTRFLKCNDLLYFFLLGAKVLFAMQTFRNCCQHFEQTESKAYVEQKHQTSRKKCLGFIKEEKKRPRPHEFSCAYFFFCNS